MAKSHQDSDMKPITWLIITGFAIASLSVILMAGLAYQQLVSLKRLVTETGKPEQYSLLLEGIFDDFDQASLDVRTKAMGAPQERSYNLELKLSQKDDQLDLMKRIANDIDPELLRITQSIEQDLQRRYQILINIEKAAEEVPIPTADAAKVQASRIDPFYLQSLFESIRGDSTKETKAARLTFLSDSAYSATLFPFLFNYSKAVAQRSLALQELLKEEQRIIRVLNVDRGEATDFLKRNRKQGYSAVEADAQNANIFIGVAGVMISTLCILFLIKITRDLERNRKLEKQLQVEKARAEELARAKEEFLANMSHEMRTPMNAIIGFSDQLADTSLEKKQQNLLKPIRHSADLLLGLINDILDYSKLEAGKFELGNQAFQLKKVIEESYQLFIPQAQAKGIDLKLEIAPNVPEVVKGDEIRLKQMLLNLGGNAVKFTDKGGVSIKVEAVKKPKEPTKVLFQVADTGIGIPAEQQDRIFNDFIQVDSSNSRKYGGTGLGLSITKKLADLHGGAINLKSKEGKGTTVDLLLPYEEGKPEEIKDVKEIPFEIHPGLAKHRVLLADDDPYNRMLVRGLLERWGMEVSSVANGKEVLQALRPPHLFSVLLIDLQMPELDGIEASKEIREEMKLNLPILALTATSSPTEQQKALDAGMQGVMLKPFKSQELHDSLIGLLKIEEERGKAEETTPTVPSSNENPFPELYKVTRGDEKMVKKMLEQYLSLTDSNLQKLQLAYQEKDAAQLALLSHRMIPAHRHLGFQSVVAHLKRIEELGERELFTQELEELMKELPIWIETCKEKVQKVLEG